MYTVYIGFKLPQYLVHCYNDEQMEALFIMNFNPSKFSI